MSGQYLIFKHYSELVPRLREPKCHHTIQTHMEYWILIGSSIFEVMHF